MEILFKNKTRYSEDLYTKFLIFHDKNYSLPYSLHTAFIVFFILFSIIIQIKANNFAVAIFFFIGITIFILWRFFGPIEEVKENFESDKIVNEKIFTFEFYKKYVKICDNNGYSFLKYKNIDKVFETSNFFYIYIDKNHALLLDKTGFCIGNCIDFSNFIRKKCIFRFKKKIESVS